MLVSRGGTKIVLTVGIFIGLGAMIPHGHGATIAVDVRAKVDRCLNTSTNNAISQNDRVSASAPHRVQYPSHTLMKGIVDWLSNRFGLPAIHDYPRIEIAAARRLAAIRHGKPISNRQKPGIRPVIASAEREDVVVLYDRFSKTIFLTDEWTGSSPSDVSVLVHEMVHHLQTIGRISYVCAAAQEKLAYQAQDLWLRQFGQDLQSAFGVDKLTILVRSTCSH